MDLTRRDLLKWFVRLIGLGVTSAAVVPSFLTGFAPVFGKPKGPRWRPIGRLSEFPVGSMQKALVKMGADGWPRALSPQAVYVWRPQEADIIVYSRSCTDLGCPVAWDPGSDWFMCPCHGGMFSKGGERVAGPAPRPLYRYASRIENGTVEIDLLSVPPMV